MKLVLLLFLGVYMVLSAQEIAVVRYMEGTVLAKSEAGTQELKVGSSLEENMLIITKESALVTIIFKDNSVLNLGENSLLKLEKFVFKPQTEEYSFDLFLQKGGLIFESGKIGDLAPEEFELKTPDGMVAIRGTKFVVNVK